MKETLNDMSIDTSSVGQIKALTYIALPAISVYLTSVGVNVKLLHGVAYMMLLDMLTAVIMWLRVDPKRLRSAILKQGLTEKLSSMVPAAVIFVILLSFDRESSALLNGYLAVLLLAEGYSAVSNAHNAYTKEVKDEYDAVSAILKVIKRHIHNLLQAALSKLGAGTTDKGEAPKNDDTEKIS